MIHQVGVQTQRWSIWGGEGVQHCYNPQGSPSILDLRSSSQVNLITRLARFEGFLDHDIRYSEAPLGNEIVFLTKLLR